MNKTDEFSEEFAKAVVERAQFNLNLSGFGGQKSSRKKNASKKLSRGLGYKTSKTKTGITITFTSKEDYAPFIEEGTRKSSKKPSPKMVESIVKWMEVKPIRLRSASGRFLSKPSDPIKAANAVKGAAYAIAKKKLERGSRPVPFFGEALDKTFEKMKTGFEEAIAADLEDLIFTNFQKNADNT